VTRFERAIYNFLNARGREIMKCLIATLCADDPAIISRVRIQRVILRTEKAIAKMPLFYFVVLKIGVYLLEYAIPPLSWKIRPFTSMNLDQRLEYLNTWSSSRFYYKRMILKLLISLCLPRLYSEKRLLLSIGFERALQGRTRKRWSTAPL